MLVQDPKDLGIYDLESRNAINHLLHTLHVVCVCVCVCGRMGLLCLYHPIQHANHSLDLQLCPTHTLIHLLQVVAEVQCLKTLLLAQYGDEHTPRPLQAFSTPFPGGGKKKKENSTSQNEEKHAPPKKEGKIFSNALQ